MKELQPVYHCAINLVIDLIGSKWKVSILWYLNEGPKRYNQLKSSIIDISSKMLTQQLKELEQHQLIRRSEMDNGAVEYAVTDLGLAFKKTLVSMCQWGDYYAERTGITMETCWTDSNGI
ncbi:helix-turn-helix domain-containing protein [Paenibacillus sp. PL2-23]|uniref:winged helix-turn-helix transcriptional regulator n=1 Tax=Paenibacillus sp. PL2-23 TaxID=2100729 RepID=UPI0030F59DE0